MFGLCEDRQCVRLGFIAMGYADILALHPYKRGVNVSK